MRFLNVPNKAFKSDSQRLAFSLRSSIAKRRSHLNAALCFIEPQQDQFKNFNGKIPSDLEVFLF